MRGNTRSSLRIQAFDGLPHNSRSACVDVVICGGKKRSERGYYPLRFMSVVLKARSAVIIDPRKFLGLEGRAFVLGTEPKIEIGLHTDTPLWLDPPTDL